MAIKAQNQITIVDITDAYSIILTNENQTFPEVGYNQGAAQINSSTTVRAYRGSEEMWVWLASPVTRTVDNITLTINKGSSVTKSTKGLTLTVTTNAAGWKSSGSLTLPILVFDREVTNPTDQSTGYLVTLNKDFSYSVAAYGNTGAAPTVYELTVDANHIVIDAEGTISPSQIRVAAIQQTGDSGYTDFEGAGISVVGHPSSGPDVPIGSSTSSRSYVDIPCSADYIYYIATLTVDNKIVDKQTIGISRDGLDGQDSYAIDVTSTYGFIFKNSAISTTLTANVYKGGSQLNNSNYNVNYGWGSADSPLCVNWYQTIEDSQTHQTSEVVIGTGPTHTISAGNVNSLLVITAKLENEKKVVPSA